MHAEFKVQFMTMFPMRISTLRDTWRFYVKSYLIIAPSFKRLMLTDKLIYGLLNKKLKILKESKSECLILSGGGKYIENPCQFAFGIVLDLVLEVKYKKYVF